MFSVVIPAYNCEKTITAVLDSVLAQTRFDLIEEIIIINDGSKDRSEEVICQYISSHPDKLIKYLTQENKGVSKTRNRGILSAQGEWIALLDSDDIWFQNKIERQYEVLKDHKDICFLGSAYPVRFITKAYRSGLVKLTPEQLCIRYTPNTPSVVFKKQDGVELGLFNEDISYGEDINFFQKFFLKDSYYVLAEKLIQTSIGKEYFNETGLSSNLKRMKQGRDRNLIEMEKMGLISKPFMLCMMAFSNLKYLRRVVLKKISAKKYR